VRVALLHPTYWPEVRRGSERMIHDLGTSLVARGHDVSLLTSHRARKSVAIEDGIRIVRRWRPPDGLPLTRAYEYHLANALNVLAGLGGGRFHVAHAFFPVDAWAAVRARRLGGPPVVFSFNGIATRPYLVARRYRLETIQAVLRGAAAVTVLSEAAARPFRRYLLCEPIVLPPGVLTESFAAGRVRRARQPTLICAASLGDPRKRGRLLIEGFERLRERRPEARLLLVRARDSVMSKAEPELCPGAEWITANRTEELAAAYASAWASVLPAVDEAFGLVLVESLAAGTPVVAARSGGCPEIVDQPGIGKLFEPDDPMELCETMEAALELAEQPKTAARCRRRAEDYDWARLVGRFEAVYQAVLRGEDACSRSGKLAA
jgi:phosphatidylinositol alpha-mannosyltransferase